MIFKIQITIFLLMCSSIECAIKPKVSIITSVYKGDLFIDQFLEDITQQTIFDQCELIIINAHSPGNEEQSIKKYAQKYDNITYISLDYDPGIYAVWNIAIKQAQGIYITNANIDDRLYNKCYELYVNALDEHPEIGLVYSDFFVTDLPNKTYNMINESNQDNACIFDHFSIQGMQQACLPNNHPMWRKSLHDLYGYFDEQYTSSGDYEMWLRLVNKGAKFLKIPCVTGVYYLNPEGISTCSDSRAYQEKCKILQEYDHLFSKIT